MRVAPHRQNEQVSLAALFALQVLDTAPEPVFDAMVSLAARLCDMPIALVSLIDADRQWFKANTGLPGVTQTSRDLAFCAHAVLGDELFEVPDATLDLRFQDNPLVTGAPHVRFYAGMPLRLSSGVCVGTICVIDHQARQLNDMQRLSLAQLATATASALEARMAICEIAAGKTRVRDLATELAEQHEMLRITLQHINDAVITTDACACVSWLNPVAERMTGWPLSEAKGMPLGEVFRLVNEETRFPVEGSVFGCLAQAPWSGEEGRTTLISRQGLEFNVKEFASPIRSSKGAVIGAVLVFQDETEHKRMAEEMLYRTSHDALTGLLNRAEFEVHLCRVMRQAKADQSMHALLFVDLDQFKLVNDAGGHMAGDEVLRQVAQLMSEIVRTSDTVVRLGGDEFALILEYCTPAHALRVAQQIGERLESHRFLHGGNRFHISASIGLIPLDDRWDTTTAILQAADQTCSAAREFGGNRVHTWTDTDLAVRERQGAMQWAARIEQALEEDRFVLYAQRIESLTDQSHGLHAEVLIRMMAPDGDVVPPGAFLPAAERFHLASRIDRWVLNRAIAWLKNLPSLSLIENLSVNLSGQSVGDKSFHLWANEVLKEAGQPICQRLCLEITETATVTNIAQAALFIEQVRAAGVRVALDDFGAGASSFGYLKKLPIDYLKIDGQFIRTLLTDELDAAAVRCFTDVAKVLGVKTVAEFVDQPAVLARLREMGVDFAQGYLLHKPAPIDQILPSSQSSTNAHLSSTISI